MKLFWLFGVRDSWQVDDDYYYPGVKATASLDDMSTLAFGTAEGGHRAAVELDVLASTVGSVPPTGGPSETVNRLTRHGVQWVCEKLDLKTSSLAMGPPGRESVPMEEFGGVRIMCP